MLEVQDLHLRYGQSPILHGISLSARPGAITAILGNNGVGKTSLLKAIAGRHPVSGGRVTLEGRDLTGARATALARAGIAYVPQGREVFPLLTVAENLQTGLACLDRSARHVPDRLFELFPVLREMRDRRGGDLSGGQQQQLAIARALVTAPRVLLLDEPTEGIQPNVIAQIGEVVARLRDEGRIAVVLVEQYFDFAHRLADRFVVMKGGRVALSGTRETLSRDDLLASLAI